jgi:hypothetical protein
MKCKAGLLLLLHQVRGTPVVGIRHTVPGLPTLCHESEEGWQRSGGHAIDDVLDLGRHDERLHFFARSDHGTSTFEV